LALLPAATNVLAGNLTFEEKKATFRADPRLLTQEVADYDQWGPNEIIGRQKKMAALALKAWPL
jgi:hypothetical protein